MRTREAEVVSSSPQCHELAIRCVRVCHVSLLEDSWPRILRMRRARSWRTKRDTGENDTLGPSKVHAAQFAYRGRLLGCFGARVRRRQVRVDLRVVLLHQWARALGRLVTYRQPKAPATIPHSSACGRIPCSCTPAAQTSPNFKREVHR